MEFWVAENGRPVQRNRLKRITREALHAFIGKLATRLRRQGKRVLVGAYNDGWRNFFFASDLHLSGNETIGSAADREALVRFLEEATRPR